MSDEAPRQELTFSIDTEELGKRNFRVMDRISVDDVTVHLAKKEIFRILTGVDEGDEVSRDIKDALVLDDYLVR